MHEFLSSNRLELTPSLRDLIEAPGSVAQFCVSVHGQVYLGQAHARTVRRVQIRQRAHSLGHELVNERGCEQHNRSFRYRPMLVSVPDDIH